MAEFSFPKSARLRKRPEFLGLDKCGRRIKNALFIAVYHKSRGPVSRLGITVTRKVGPAHVRNRIKRHIREFFRQNRSRLKENNDIHIIAKRQAAGAVFTSARGALRDIFEKMASHA